MKKLLLVALLWTATVGTAWSKTVEEMLLESLQAQGYVILEEGYTFLGRLRIVAMNGDIRREIVVNPGTGEILRDYAVRLPQFAATKPDTKGGGTTAATAGGDPVQGSPDDGTTLGAGAGVGTAGTSTDDAAQRGTAGDVGNYTSDDVALDAIVLDPLFPMTDDTQ